MADQTRREREAKRAPARKELARRLAHARNRLGWTQTTAAAAAGLTNETLSRLERGVQGAGIETLVQLADAYGVDPSELLGFKTRRGQPDTPKRAALEQALGLLRTQSAENVELAVRLLRVLFAEGTPRPSRPRR